MDMDWLKGLIALVEDSGVDALDLEVVGEEPGDPTRIRIRKSPRVAAAAAPPVAMVGGAPPSAGGQAGAAAPAAPEAEPEEALVDVVSPMVGTFYRAPAVGADPFVSVGDRVEAGQTLCILEAMKLMNELESEVTGTVREVAVENAEPVEFGALLFRIDPD